MASMRILWASLLLLIGLFSDAQVKISGTAKNYNDTVFFISEPGGFYNYTRAWRDNSVKIKIEKNGRFEAIIPETSINTWYIKTGKGNQFFDLISGKNIELVADFSQASPLMAVGSNSANFNYSSYAIDRIRKNDTYKKLNSKIGGANIDSALFYRKEIAVLKLNVLNNYKKYHPISDAYYKWLRSGYLYEPYERTLVENISNKNSVDENTLKKIIEKGTNDEYAALNTSGYNDLIDFYIRTKYMQKSNGEGTIDGYFDFAVNSNLIKGNTRDVSLSRLMYLMRTAPDSQYVPIFKKYDRIVSNKKMKQAVIYARDDYSKSVVPLKPDFARAKSITEIFAKYKGSVIYVDFWASWCVPCRAEMPDAGALKDKLKGKNVVFLYMGYNDKEKAWAKARNQLNIEGEHYLLDEKTVKEADEVFGINGIPHYAIIDRDGNIVNKRADRPNDVYQELLTQIEK
ncbi:TlpA family protein disulfide reductase [Niabella aquatica]